MHLYIVTIPVSTISTASLRITTLGRTFDFIGFLFFVEELQCIAKVSHATLLVTLFNGHNWREREKIIWF